MLPEDVQPEETKFKGVPSFAVLPIFEEAKSPETQVTPKAIEEFKKEIQYRVRFRFKAKIYNFETKTYTKISDIIPSGH